MYLDTEGVSRSGHNLERGISGKTGQINRKPRLAQSRLRPQHTQRAHRRDHAGAPLMTDYIERVADCCCCRWLLCTRLSNHSIANMNAWHEKFSFFRAYLQLLRMQICRASRACCACELLCASKLLILEYPPWMRKMAFFCEFDTLTGFSRGKKTKDLRNTLKNPNEIQGIKSEASYDERRITCVIRLKNRNENPEFKSEASSDKRLSHLASEPVKFTTFPVSLLCLSLGNANRERIYVYQVCFLHYVLTYVRFQRLSQTEIEGHK